MSNIREPTDALRRGEPMPIFDDVSGREGSPVIARPSTPPLFRVTPPAAFGFMKAAVSAPGSFDGSSGGGTSFSSASSMQPLAQGSFLSHLRVATIDASSLHSHLSELEELVRTSQQQIGKHRHHHNRHPKQQQLYVETAALSQSQGNSEGVLPSLSTLPSPSSASTTVDQAMPPTGGEVPASSTLPPTLAPHFSHLRSSSPNRGPLEEDSQESVPIHDAGQRATNSGAEPPQQRRAEGQWTSPPRQRSGTSRITAADAGEETSDVQHYNVRALYTSSLNGYQQQRLTRLTAQHLRSLWRRVNAMAEVGCGCSVLDCIRSAAIASLQPHGLNTTTSPEFLTSMRRTEALMAMVSSASPSLSCNTWATPPFSGSSAAPLTARPQDINRNGSGDTAVATAAPSSRQGGHESGVPPFHTDPLRGVAAVDDGAIEPTEAATAVKGSTLREKSPKPRHLTASLADDAARIVTAAVMGSHSSRDAGLLPPRSPLPPTSPAAVASTAATSATSPGSGGGFESICSGEAAASSLSVTTESVTTPVLLTSVPPSRPQRQASDGGGGGLPRTTSTLSAGFDGGLGGDVMSGMVTGAAPGTGFGPASLTSPLARSNLENSARIATAIGASSSAMNGSSGAMMDSCRSASIRVCSTSSNNSLKSATYTLPSTLLQHQQHGSGQASSQHTPSCSGLGDAIAATASPVPPSLSSTTTATATTTAVTAPLAPRPPLSGSSSGGGSLATPLTAAIAARETDISSPSGSMRQRLPLHGLSIESSPNATVQLVSHGEEKADATGRHGFNDVEPSSPVVPARQGDIAAALVVSTLVEDEPGDQRDSDDPLSMRNLHYRNTDGAALEAADGAQRRRRGSHPHRYASPQRRGVRADESADYDSIEGRDLALRRVAVEHTSRLGGGVIRGSVGNATSATAMGAAEEAVEVREETIEGAIDTNDDEVVLEGSTELWVSSRTTQKDAAVRPSGGTTELVARNGRGENETLFHEVGTSRGSGNDKTSVALAAASSSSTSSAIESLQLWSGTPPRKITLAERIMASRTTSLPQHFDSHNDHDEISSSSSGDGGTRSSEVEALATQETGLPVLTHEFNRNIENNHATNETGAPTVDGDKCGDDASDGQGGSWSPAHFDATDTISAAFSLEPKHQNRAILAPTEVAAGSSSPVLIHGLPLAIRDDLNSFTEVPATTREAADESATLPETRADQNVDQLPSTCLNTSRTDGAAPADAQSETAVGDVVHDKDIVETPSRRCQLAIETRESIPTSFLDTEDVANPATSSAEAACTNVPSNSTDALPTFPLDGEVATTPSQVERPVLGRPGASPSSSSPPILPPSSLSAAAAPNQDLLDLLSGPITQVTGASSTGSSSSTATTPTTGTGTGTINLSSTHSVAETLQLLSSRLDSSGVASLQWSSLYPPASSASHSTRATSLRTPITSLSTATTTTTTATATAGLWSGSQASQLGGGTWPSLSSARTTVQQPETSLEVETAHATLTQKPVQSSVLQKMQPLQLVPPPQGYPFELAGLLASAHGDDDDDDDVEEEEEEEEAVVGDTLSATSRMDRVRRRRGRWPWDDSRVAASDDAGDEGRCLAAPSTATTTTSTTPPPTSLLPGDMKVEGRPSSLSLRTDLALTMTGVIVTLSTMTLNSSSSPASRTSEGSTPRPSDAASPLRVATPVASSSRESYEEEVEEAEEETEEESDGLFSATAIPTSALSEALLLFKQTRAGEVGGAACCDAIDEEVRGREPSRSPIAVTAADVTAPLTSISAVAAVPSSFISAGPTDHRDSEHEEKGLLQLPQDLADNHAGAVGLPVSSEMGPVESIPDEAVAPNTIPPFLNQCNPSKPASMESWLSSLPQPPPPPLETATEDATKLPSTASSPLPLRVADTSQPLNVLQQKVAATSTVVEAEAPLVCYDEQSKSDSSSVASEPSQAYDSLVGAAPSASLPTRTKDNPCSARKIDDDRVTTTTIVPLSGADVMVALQPEELLHTAAEEIALPKTPQLSSSQPIQLVERISTDPLVYPAGGSGRVAEAGPSLSYAMSSATLQLPVDSTDKLKVCDAADPPAPLFATAKNHPTFATTTTHATTAASLLRLSSPDASGGCCLPYYLARCENGWGCPQGGWAASQLSSALHRSSSFFQASSALHLNVGGRGAMGERASLLTSSAASLYCRGVEAGIPTPPPFPPPRHQRREVEEEEAARHDEEWVALMRQALP